MSKTAVAHKSALGSTNIWHTSTPQADFLSKGEHGIITQRKAHFSQQTSYSDRHLSLLPVWVTFPRFSTFRKNLLLSGDKNSTQPLGEARFQGGERQRQTSLQPLTIPGFFSS